MTQLSLEDATPTPNPNADWFGPDGKPKRMLKCADGDEPCPHGGSFPAAKLGLYDPYDGACCKDIAANPAGFRHVYHPDLSVFAGDCSVCGRLPEHEIHRV